MPDKSSIGTVGRAPTKDEERERLVPIIKEFRREIDALIQRVSRPVTRDEQLHGPAIWPHNGHFETEQVRTKLIEAKMWAGKILEALGNPFPAELADKANVQ